MGCRGLKGARREDMAPLRVTLFGISGQSVGWARGHVLGEESGTRTPKVIAVRLANEVGYLEALPRKDERRGCERKPQGRQVHRRRNG
jgi:hypothetical protein